jgi:hypothetical protein
LFCVITPPVVTNGIEPDVNPNIARLVVVARFALKLVIVPEAEIRSEIFALEIVVVAKVEVPVTTKVLVVVLFVVVKLSMNAVAAFNRVAKKLVDDAKSKKALVE